MGPAAITATVFGYNEIVDRTPVLTRVHVVYRLETPAGSREAVERALGRHAARCPTALSLKGAIAVTWEAHVQEGEERWRAEGDRDA